MYVPEKISLDPYKLDDQFNQCLEIATNLAYFTAHTNPGSDNFEVAIGAALEGISKAAVKIRNQTTNPPNLNNFEAYARQQAKWTMIDELRQYSPLSQNQLELLRDLKAQSAIRDLTGDETSALQSMESFVEPLPLNDPVEAFLPDSDSDLIDLQDSLPDPNSIDPQEACENMESFQQIINLASTIDPRFSIIYLEHFVNGRTLMDIAPDVGVNTETGVSQIITRTIKQIKLTLNSEID
jgi:RNA polymerase sigma factor (sigma-70 family)